MSSPFKSVALAAATAFAIFGGVGAAEAHGKHFGFHKFHNFHSFAYGPRYRVVIGGDECGFLYRRWRLTGSSLWKHEYYACRGWY